MTPPQRTADVIVVLGTALRHDGTPSRPLRDRVMHGIALFRDGAAETLLFTGGLGSAGILEAEAMRALALSEGVPETSIVIETNARTTLENALYSARIMRERGWKTALVVSDWLHLLRALLAFRSMGVRARGSRVAITLPRGRVGLAAIIGYVAHELMGLAWYVVVILFRRPRP